MRAPILLLPVVLLCAVIGLMIHHTSPQPVRTEDQVCIQAHIAHLRAEQSRVQHDLQSMEDYEVRHFLPRGGMN